MWLSSKGNSGTFSNASRIVFSFDAFHSQKILTTLPSAFVRAKEPARLALVPSFFSILRTSGMASSTRVGQGVVCTAMDFRIVSRPLAES